MSKKSGVSRDSSPTDAQRDKMTSPIDIPNMIAPSPKACQASDSTRFLVAARAATEGKSGMQRFTCPLCGGRARAVRSKADGLVVADCPQCGRQEAE